MTNFRGTKDFIDAELDGKVRTFVFRKAPTVGTAPAWQDISVAPGNPKAKLWFDAEPLVAQALAQSTDGGIFHGSNVSPSTKYIKSFMAYNTSLTSIPHQIIVCDYLLYYPTIDDSASDAQILDNTTTLPRYTTGAGVQVIPVNLAARTNSVSFYITYTNQDGVAGRTSKTVFLNNNINTLGSIALATAAQVTSNIPFIPLQDGDSGVRSIESVQMLTTDVGLFALILVKPLFSMSLGGTLVSYEKDLLMQGATMPIIQDDAYISFFILANGSPVNSSFIGEMKTIWT